MTLRRFPTAGSGCPPKNARMLANQSSHLWLTRFCGQLLRMDPELSVRVAVRRAVAAYPYASELRPEEAARIAALNRPIGGRLSRGPLNAWGV